MQRPIDLQINAIEVPGRRVRPYDRQKADTLRRSIERDGLRSLIVVRLVANSNPKRYRLVAGNYRKHVMEELGYQTIPAFVITSRSKARIFEVMENSARVPLTALEQAEHDVREIRLIEQDERKKTGFAKRRVSLSRLAKLAKKVGKTDQSRRKHLERAIKIASIHPDAKEKIRAIGQDDCQSLLLAVAKEEKLTDQLEVIEQYKHTKDTKKKPNDANRKSSRSRGKRELQSALPGDGSLRSLRRVWKGSEAATLWDAADSSTKNQFINWLKSKISENTEEDWDL